MAKYNVSFIIKEHIILTHEMQHVKPYLRDKPGKWIQQKLMKVMYAVTGVSRGATKEG